MAGLGGRRHSQRVGTPSARQDLLLSAATVGCQAQILLIEVALASGKIEIVALAEPFQDRLNVGSKLQGLY